MKFAALRAIAVALLSLPAAMPAAAGPVSLDDYADGARFLIPALAAVGTVAVGDKDGFMQLAFSAANTVALTEALKLAIHADRPNGKGDDSFPSGHAATAFAGAAFVHDRYGWQWGIPAELAAAGVAYAQVHNGDHRWGDVVAGATIAQLSAYFYVDPRDSGVRFLPFVDVTKHSFNLVVKLGF